MTEPTATWRPRIFHQSAGVVVLDADRCLVLRRGSEWIFPKGHLEANEQPIDAAIREVREETSLEIEVDGYVGNTRYEFGPADGPGMTKSVHWYWGHRVGGAIQVEETFDEALFVPKAEALSRLTHDADREIATQAFEFAAGRDVVDDETRKD